MVMFVLFDKEDYILPIKVWLGHKSQLETGCQEQAENLARHPAAFHHIALMPDTHQGYGMPIGGVMACKNAVIPYAVGVDIGCGMRYCQTDIKWEDIKQVTTGDGQEIRKAILGNVMRNVPVGYNHHKTEQVWPGFDQAPDIKVVQEQLDSARKQLGTLGSGNHFIELQVDRDGRLAIMIHSGSRNFGKQICDVYNQIAKDMNEKWHSNVDPKWNLAFLPTDSTEGKEYISAMNYALDFAHANRKLMMERTKNVVFNMITKYSDVKNIEVLTDIDIHHNYATMENHFGQNVMVHRKGATRAVINRLGIIPGSMGTPSYIVRGRNNPDSFHSCSHGAGRAMGCKAAQKKYSVEHVIKTMKDLDIVLVTPNKEGIASECIEAYKSIEDVIKHEYDLIEIENKLRPIGVLKG